MVDVAGLGVTDVVDFHGHVDEQAKHEELARAWVHLCPSVKEGWGLVVTEAGVHRPPYSESLNGVVTAA